MVYAQAYSFYQPALLTLRAKAHTAYARRHPNSNDRTIELELALRLSGDRPVIDSMAKRITLADSPAFQDVHPAIVQYLEELGPSGGVTPWAVEGEYHAKHQESLGSVELFEPFIGVPSSNAVGESWQFYLARLGLPI